MTHARDANLVSSNCLAHARDTNLASSSCLLPMAFHFRFYEPFCLWLAKRSIEVRREAAEQIEATARSLGLEGFQSTLRRELRI